MSQVVVPRSELQSPVLEAACFYQTVSFYLLYCFANSGTLLLSPLCEDPQLSPPFRAISVLAKQPAIVTAAPPRVSHHSQDAHDFCVHQYQPAVSQPSMIMRAE